MQALLSLLLGCVLTYAVLELGYSPPTILDLPNKVKAIPEQLIASSFIEDPKADLKQKQTAIAIMIKNSSQYFIEIDNASNNQFTHAAINKITDHKLLLIKSYTLEFANLLEKNTYPSLRKHLIERYKTTSVTELKIQIMKHKIAEDPFVYAELKRRYPGRTDEQIVRRLLNLAGE
ncbi:hypothetical protein [uncultured Paraglaciecola sp.]|uniref:hypothetical protein n=1 Tax=uncultured Paraglaciecola sp. TaxID=1765024 RepID=UPI0030DBE3B9|tara:strand:- start:127927 stop:128454 length:528 start_codon:yes stop_codon:yes gene_type:complete